MWCSTINRPFFPFLSAPFSVAHPAGSCEHIKEKKLRLAFSCKFVVTYEWQWGTNCYMASHLTLTMKRDHHFALPFLLKIVTPSPAVSMNDTININHSTFNNVLEAVPFFLIVNSHSKSKLYTQEQLNLFFHTLSLRTTNDAARRIEKIATSVQSFSPFLDWQCNLYIHKAAAIKSGPLWLCHLHLQARLRSNLCLQLQQCDRVHLPIDLMVDFWWTECMYAFLMGNVTCQLATYLSNIVQCNLHQQQHSFPLDWLHPTCKHHWLYWVFQCTYLPSWTLISKKNRALKVFSPLTDSQSTTICANHSSVRN